MSYSPKSKINIQTTPGGEFVYKLTKRDYIGTYIETSDGSFYAGGDPSDLSTELELPLVSKVQFGGGPDVQDYKRIKPTPHLFLAKTSPVIGAKPKPTEEDYNRGYFGRFFAKKHNVNTDYIEIDAETYIKLSKKEDIYDYHLYKVGFITWTLKGDVININTNNIEKLKKEFPFLYTLFPLLNEFQKTNKRLQYSTMEGFQYQYPESSGGGGGGY